jgi:hypothetical protein
MFTARWLGLPPGQRAVLRTVASMNEALEATSKIVADLTAFGAATSQLGNLSRYADNACAAALAGTITTAELAPFCMSVLEFYDRIGIEILGVIQADFLEFVSDGLPELPAGADIFTTALVLDQAIVWLSSHVLPNNFERQLRLSAMKMTIEESMTNEELGKTKGDRALGGLYA